MELNRKTKIGLAVFWVIVLVALIWVLIRHFNSRPAYRAPVPSYVNSSWRTYTNERFGFQFEVPVSFRVEENSDETGTGIDVFDPFGYTKYLTIITYPGNLDMSGSFPTTTPGNEKNGEMTISEANFNGIQGLQTTGIVDEGTNYADDFAFERNGRIYRIELNAFEEGVSSGVPWLGENIDKDTYMKIRQSFKLVGQ